MMFKSGTKAAASVAKHDVVIIGGGVGGLSTAVQLFRSGVTDIKLFESRKSVGGRIITTRDEEGKPLFNDFAWRIGADNTRMLKICKELGVEVAEQYTPEAGAPHDGTAASPPAGRAPLSAFAANTLKSTAQADQADRESGYAGRTAQIAFPGDSHATKNYVVKEGMNVIAQKFAAMLPEGTVSTGHRCTDITRTEDGEYLVDISSMGGAKTIQAKTVILAVPPVSIRQLSIAKEGLNPALFAIHQRRLGHIYVKCAPGPNVPDTSTDDTRIYRSVPDSILQQVISGDYGNSVFQAGYACDRFERVWRELQYQGPEVLKEEVKKQLDALTATVLPELKGVEIEKVFLRIGFVHRWQVEAHVNGKTREELSRQAVYPNSAKLPNLYLVGEAFSAHQGWTEGALQTAEECVAMVLAARKGDAAALNAALSPYSQPKAVERGSNPTMAYQGLVLDVSTWAERHPGGAGPIRGFTGKDSTEMFNNVHGLWPGALATVFGLQSGVVANKD